MNVISSLLYLVTLIDITPLQQFRTLSYRRALSSFVHCTMEQKMEQELYDYFPFYMPPYLVTLSQDETNIAFQHIKYHFLPKIRDCVMSYNNTKPSHQLFYDRMNMRFSDYIVTLLLQESRDGYDYPLFHEALQHYLQGHKDIESILYKYTYTSEWNLPEKVIDTALKTRYVTGEAYRFAQLFCDLASKFAAYVWKNGTFKFV